MPVANSCLPEPPNGIGTASVVPAPPRPGLARRRFFVAAGSADRFVAVTVVAVAVLGIVNLCDLHTSGGSPSVQPKHFCDAGVWLFAFTKRHSVDGPYFKQLAAHSVMNCNVVAVRALPYCTINGGLCDNMGVLL